MKTITTLLSGAAMLAASTALAQDDASPMSGMDAVLAEMDIHVTDVATEGLSSLLDADHIAVLKSLAHQHAIGATCDNFEVDETRNTEELAHVFEHLGKIEGEDEVQAAILTVMMGYSVMLGGQHAIAATDYSKFCRHAADEMANEGPDAHLILVMSE